MIVLIALTDLVDATRQFVLDHKRKRLEFVAPDSSFRIELRRVNAERIAVFCDGGQIDELTQADVVGGFIEGALEFRMRYGRHFRADEAAVADFEMMLREGSAVLATLRG